jgi:hypothetical protein
MAKQVLCEVIRETVIRVGERVGVRATVPLEGDGVGARPSWGLGLEEEAEEAHTGFEPVLREDDDEPPLGRESDARAASELPADLQRIVERLSRGTARAERE